MPWRHAVRLKWKEYAPGKAYRGQTQVAQRAPERTAKVPALGKSWEGFLEVVVRLGWEDLALWPRNSSLES